MFPVRGLFTASTGLPAELYPQKADPAPEQDVLHRTCIILPSGDELVNRKIYFSEGKCGGIEI